VRTVDDQQHLAEYAVSAQGFEQTVAAPDLDFAAHNDEELVAASPPWKMKIGSPLAELRVGTSGCTRD
jgi:hypothetical protein